VGLFHEGEALLEISAGVVGAEAAVRGCVDAI